MYEEKEESEGDVFYICGNPAGTNQLDHSGEPKEVSRDVICGEVLNSGNYCCVCGVTCWKPIQVDERLE